MTTQLKVIVSPLFKYHRRYREFKQRALHLGKVINEHLEWIAEQFDHLPNDRVVEVHLRPIRDLKDVGICWPFDNPKRGVCRIDLDPRHIMQSSRAFIIDSMMETLFHELTHVEQFSQKRLNMGSEGTNWTMWDGKRLSFDPDCPIQYKEAPWEIEANAKGKKVLKKFKRTKI